MKSTFRPCSPDETLKATAKTQTRTAYNASYYLKNKEKFKARNREYHQKHLKEDLLRIKIWKAQRSINNWIKRLTLMEAELLKIRKSRTYKR